MKIPRLYHISSSNDNHKSITFELTFVWSSPRRDIGDDLSRTLVSLEPAIRDAKCDACTIPSFAGMKSL